jgi:hypothetical protein
VGECQLPIHSWHYWAAPSGRCKFRRLCRLCQSYLWGRDVTTCSCTHQWGTRHRSIYTLFSVGRTTRTKSSTSWDKIYSAQNMQKCNSSKFPLPRYRPRFPFSRKEGQQEFFTRRHIGCVQVKYDRQGYLMSSQKAKEERYSLDHWLVKETKRGRVRCALLMI